MFIECSFLEESAYIILQYRMQSYQRLVARVEYSALCCDLDQREEGPDSGDDLLCRGSVTLYYAPITFGNDDKGSCQKNLYHKARLTVRGEDGECFILSFVDD